MRDLIIDCFAGGGADREQRGADYGKETGRSKLSLPESRGKGTEHGGGRKWISDQIRVRSVIYARTDQPK